MYAVGIPGHCASRAGILRQKARHSRHRIAFNEAQYPSHPSTLFNQQQRFLTTRQFHCQASVTTRLAGLTTILHGTARTGGPLFLAEQCRAHAVVSAHVCVFPSHKTTTYNQNSDSHSKQPHVQHVPQHICTVLSDATAGRHTRRWSLPCHEISDSAATLCCGSDSPATVP